jgi:glycosyltransferase involved in cell wall biosynthesis
MIVPSYAESPPYVVLEAAAGKPLIVTRVGGLPEIYRPLSDNLVPARDPAALAAAITRTLDDCAAAERLAIELRERVSRGFSLRSMVDGVLDAYQAGLAVKQRQPARR